MVRVGIHILCFCIPLELFVGASGPLAQTDCSTSATTPAPTCTTVNTGRRGRPSQKRSWRSCARKHICLKGNRRPRERLNLAMKAELGVAEFVPVDRGMLRSALLQALLQRLAIHKLSGHRWKP